MNEEANNTDWKKKLTPEQYAVLRQKGTEPPFSGKLLHEKRDGMYTCAACGNALFASDAKFDSGTGWPSFDDALSGSTKLVEDNQYDMHRTEVVCANCGSHLGHVFNDPPRLDIFGEAGGQSRTGKRFCINSVCLDLKPKE